MAAHSHFVICDAPHDAIPRFKKIGTSRIEHHAESTPICISGEYVPNQLIAETRVIDFRQRVDIEQATKITVTLQNHQLFALEVRFRKLRLDQKMSESHVDLGAVETPI